MLHGIKREVLPHLLFPVGGYTKPEIRRFAREAGLLGVADKPDSVEICFVPERRPHRRGARAGGPKSRRPACIVEKDGTVLGEHDGIDRFTVGQRKGLGVAAGPEAVRAGDPAGDARRSSSATRRTCSPAGWSRRG